MERPRLLIRIPVALIGLFALVDCGGGQKLYNRDRNLPGAAVRRDVELEPVRGKLITGITALREGDTERARAAFAAYATETPTSALAPYHLGIIAWEAGDVATARTQWQRALQNNPKLHGAAVNLGLLYLATEEEAAAIKVLEGAVAVAPDDVRVLAALAQARLARGHWTEAIEAYRKALSKAPGHGTLLYDFALALTERHLYDEALLKLNEAITYRPGFADARALRVACLTAMDRTAQAVKQADEDVALIDNHAGLHVARGRALLVAGKLSDGTDALRKAVSLAPEDGNALLALAEVLDARKEHGEAMALYKRYLKTPRRHLEDSRRARQRLKQLERMR